MFIKKGQRFKFKENPDKTKRIIRKANLMEIDKIK
jgi:hypothetical protein